MCTTLSCTDLSDMLTEGLKHFEEGKYKEAIKCYRKGQKYDPKNPDLYFEEAMACLHNEDEDGAILALKHVNTLADGYRYASHYLKLIDTMENGYLSFEGYKALYAVSRPSHLSVVQRVSFYALFYSSFSSRFAVDC